MREIHEYYEIVGTNSDEEGTYTQFHRTFESQEKAIQAFSVVSNLYSPDLLLTVTKEFIAEENGKWEALATVKLFNSALAVEPDTQEEEVQLDIKLDWDTEMPTTSAKKSDKQVFEEYGIPTRTLQDWKNKSTDNWRKKVYEHLCSGS